MNNDVLNGTSTAAGDAIKVLRADIKPLMQGSDLTQGVTGTAAQQLDSQQSGSNAEKIVTIATLALILILLLVIFRSPIIALLPLIVIAIVSQVATGLISDVNSALHLNGPTLAIAVGVTLVAGLTLVPAVVSLLGKRVFWPSKAWQREPKGARFAAIGGAVGRRPAVFAAVSGLVLIALTLGALGFKPTFDLASAGIPSNAESVTALNTLEKGLPPGATDPTEIYLHAPSGMLSQAEIAGYGAKLKTMPGAGAVGQPTVSKDGATAAYTVTLSYNPDSTQAVNVLKDQLVPDAHAAAPPGTFALVGGTTSVFADIQRAVNHDYAVVFPRRRGDHPAHPGAAAAQRGSAVVPDGLGGARVRRDARRDGAGVPEPRGPGGPGVPAADLHVPVRGGARHRLQHPHDRAAARAVQGGDEPA